MGLTSVGSWSMTVTHPDSLSAPTMVESQDQIVPLARTVSVKIGIAMSGQRLRNGLRHGTGENANVVARPGGRAACLGKYR